MRKDIQYLRAIAVAAVVLYHLWPSRVTGGYVGVDIFFVISGFLISTHLLKEVTSSNKLSFTKFYARRARRILPSAITVLILTIIGTLIWTPLSEWATSFRQLFASTLFFENWQLAADSVDYLTAEAAPSPVQHYWSLSVEEQFYLAWPLLLWLVFLYARSRKRAYTKSVLLLFAIVGGASVLYSILLTQADPVPAFYSTGTRVWEFIAGGLLALLPRHGSANKIPSAIAAFSGWIAVLVSICFYTNQTPFPGWAAMLPVFGTALIIWAKIEMASTSKLKALMEKPVLVTAELSFAIYLFHWPLIIFGEQALGHPLGWRSKLAILALTVLLAWATTRFVEQPIRFGTISQNLTDRTQLVIALSCIFALALTTFTANSIIGKLSDTANASSISAELPPCFGALAIYNADQCKHVTYEQLTPDPELAYLDKSEIATGSECGATQDQTEVFSCEFGNPNSKFRVALIGDSHAMAIFPAIKAIAEEENWSLTTYVRSACPFLKDGYKGDLTQREQNCNVWNSNLATELARKKTYNLVFVTSNHRNTLWGTDSEAASSLIAAWEQIIEKGTKIIAIRDVPNMHGVLKCLLDEKVSAKSCDYSVNLALGSDPQVLASSKLPGSYLIDLSDYFCDVNVCKIAVGGVITHRDDHHITQTFAKSLTDPIRQKLEGLGLLDTK